MSKNTEETEFTLQAEYSLIGAILIDASDMHSREALEGAMKYVTPDMFLDHGMARIFLAMRTCKEAPNMINVGAEMSLGGIGKMGDFRRMARAAAECPCSLDYEDYAKQVARYYQSRTPQIRKKGVDL